MTYSNIPAFRPEESVFLVGAGVSCPPLPKGDGLQNYYLESLSGLHPELDPFVDVLKKATPPLEVLLGTIARAAGSDFLSTLAFLNEAKPNQNHRVLARLLVETKLALVATTNLDNLIEKAGKSLRVYTTDSSTPLDQMAGGILKLHGNADDAESIMATIERINKERSNQKMVKYLGDIVRKKYVYVCGYRGADQDIVEPIRNAEWKGLYWFGREEHLCNEVREMVERHPNAHFVELNEDYNLPGTGCGLLEEIARQMNLQLPPPSVGRFPEERMRQAIHSHLAFLGKSSVQFVIGSLLHHSGKNEDAREVLSGAVRSNSRSSSRVIGWMHLELAKVQKDLGWLTHPVSHCQTALKRALEETDIADAACTEASLYATQPLSAETALVEASRRTLSDPRAQARIRSALGDVYVGQGKLVEALRCYEEAEGIYGSMEMPEALPACYNSIGMVHLDLGNLSEARASYRRAQRFSRRLQNRYHERCALIHLGQLEWYFGNHADAVKLVEAARNIERHYLPPSTENATTCEIYAKILIDSGELSKAQEEIARGLQLLGDADPSQKVCLRAVKLHMWGNQRERRRQGLTLITQINAILEKHQDSKYDVRWFYLYAAEFYLKQVDLDRRGTMLDKAEAMLDKAEAMIRDRGSYAKAFYFYLRWLLSNKRGNPPDVTDPYCRSCKDVIEACRIKPGWAYQLP